MGIKYVYLLWEHWEDGPRNLKANLHRDMLEGMLYKNSSALERLKEVLKQTDKELADGDGINELEDHWGGIHLQVVELK